jgi:regulator of sirC expression with transglutaminase-like and TPR domain
MLPICCPHSAFDLLSLHIKTIEQPRSLVAAACALTLPRYPKTRYTKVQKFIDDVAKKIKTRVRGSQKQAMLAHFHEHFFEELQYHGNEKEYYAEDNHYLPRVVETRMGLPVTLAVLYRCIAGRLDIPCWGVGLPGHFLCGVNVDGKDCLVDVFNQGGLIVPEQAKAMMLKSFEGEYEWEEEYLKPATHNYWITRISHNLLNHFAERKDYQSMAAILELQMLLHPQAIDLHRDLGLILARLERSEPAKHFLHNYLEAAEKGPETDEIREVYDMLNQ